MIKGALKGEDKIEGIWLNKDLNNGKCIGTIKTNTTGQWNVTPSFYFIQDLSLILFLKKVLV